jgi:hypothetical protein
VNNTATSSPAVLRFRLNICLSSAVLSKKRT